MAGVKKLLFVFQHVFTFLQRLNVTAGQSDPNAVNGHFGLHRSLAGILVCLK